MRRLVILLLSIGSFSVIAQVQQGKDDPQARREFEFTRTKNPVTNKIPAGIRIKERMLMDQRQQELKARINPLVAAPSPAWENRGPYNVGGRTRALAIDLTDETEETILAGGVSGGLWRTTDGGDNWSKMTTPTDLQSITCIVQDTVTEDIGASIEKGDIWYYGTGEFSGNSASGFGAPYRGDGIFKSEDGGMSWSRLAFTVGDVPQSFESIWDYNHEVVVNPTNGDVFVANFGGIWRSQNQGSDFTEVLDGLDIAGVGGWTDVAVTSEGILYAVKNIDIVVDEETQDAGIYQSTDGGDTWTDITDANHSFSSGERKEIAIAPSNEDIVYILGQDETESSGHSLWKFDDATDTWTDLSANIPQLGGQTGDFDSQGGYDLLIKVKNDDPNFVVIGGTNLFASSDGFSSIANTNWIGGYTSSNNSFALYPNHHPDQHSFVFLDGDRAYSGNDGGVQLTSDITASTVSWTSLNNGYLTSQIYAVSAGPENQLLVGLQDNGTWFASSSTTSESDWSDPFGGDGAYSAISNDGVARFMSAQNANIGVFRYSGGPDDETAESAWVFVPSEELGYKTQLFITPFYLDPNDNDLFYLGGDSELWVNTEATSDANVISGSNQGWKPITLTGSVGVVSELGVGLNEVVYAGTSSGNLFRVSNVTDGNPIVENVTGVNFPSGYISGIGVNPTNNDKVLVSFSNYSIPSLFYTSDAGKTWTDVSGNLEENTDGSGSGPSVRVARILGNGLTYFAGTSTGLYSTSTLDGTNTTWVREDEGEGGIGATVVEHMVTRLDGLVVAATHGNGVFSSDFPMNDNDLFAKSLDQPERKEVFESTSSSILVSIQNIGEFSVSDFDISLYIDEELIASDNVTQTINSFDVYQHTFSETYNFNTIGEYDVRVEVSFTDEEDDTNNTLEAKVMSLAIPTDILLSNNTIDESNSLGTVIGTFEALDEDDDTHIFTLVNGEGADDNSSFVISETELLSDTEFNFSAKSVYTIRIQTEDDDGNSFAKSFQINISGVLAAVDWEEAGITVYPNPSKGRMTIEMINDYIGEVSVRILSLDGKELLRQDAYPKTAKSTRSLLDISNLDQGTYFVKFTFGDKEIISRLIKE